MRNFYLFIVLFTLSSCGAKEYKSGIDFDDFRNKVKNTAGINAIDCGQVEISSNQLTTNTCVAESFLRQSPFFGIYKGQGTDSSVATGIAFGVDYKVHFLYFDSDPSGGGKKDNGKISQSECLNAKLGGSVDVDYYDLFSCDQPSATSN